MAFRSFESAGATEPCINFTLGACPTVTVDDPSPLSGCVGDTIILTGTGFGDPQFPLVMLFMIMCVWAYQFMFESRLKTVLERAPVRIGVAFLMIAYLCICTGGSESAFIYFQF